MTLHPYFYNPLAISIGIVEILDGYYAYDFAKHKVLFLVAKKHRS